MNKLIAIFFVLLFLSSSYADLSSGGSSGGGPLTQGTVPWIDDITQFGDNAVVTGTGASGLGIPSFTISNDSHILATQSGA